MTPLDEPPGFERWLDEISDHPGDPDSGKVSDSWRPWLRDFFEREGPVAKDVVRDAAMRDQLSLAKQATALVLADLHQTTSLRPEVDVEVWDESDVRIRIDGSFSSLSMLPNLSQAVAEVADYFQEQLSQRVGIWPTCSAHDVGLHAWIREGRAMWRCQRGDQAHVIALIGELGQAT